MGETTARGRCACGGVSFETSGALRPVINCHCDRCRRITGHFMAATNSRNDELVVRDAGSLRWYEPATGVFYGFCQTCGSTLFWRTDGSDTTSIAAGTLDPPTGLHTASAWYVTHASDYHRLDQDLDNHATE